jgi:hypothetical protein
MPSILEGELADAVNEAMELANVPRTIVITRTEYGPPPEPGEPGEEVTTEYQCRGWTEAYDDDALAGTLIDAKDVRIVVLATSIAIVPTDTELVTIEGRLFTIINVKRDASGALYFLQARA